MFQRCFRPASRQYIEEVGAITTLVPVERVLAKEVKPPDNKNFWRRRAIVRYLREAGYHGSCYNTLRVWDKRILRVIKDFRKRIPKNSQGRYSENYPFDAYQFWVLLKVSPFLGTLDADLNGSSYLHRAAELLASERYQSYLSYESYLYEINSGESAVNITETA